MFLNLHNFNSAQPVYQQMLSAGYSRSLCLWVSNCELDMEMIADAVLTKEWDRRDGREERLRIADEGTLPVRCSQVKAADRQRQRD